MRVDNIGNLPITSMLYDPLLNLYAPNSYRRVTATAVFGGTVKQIRAVLQPVYAGSLDPTFPYAGFGIARFVFVGKAGTNSYNSTDPRTLADVGALGKISQVSNGSLPRGIAEGGSHYEYPDPVSYYNQQFQITGQQFGATPATTAPWMQIYGNKYSNGGNTAYFERTGPGDPGTSNPAHNVFGVDNGIKSGIPSGTGPGDNLPVGSPPVWSGGKVNFNPSPTTNGVTYQQPTIPPAPTAPPGTFNLGSINIQGSGHLQIQAGAPAPTGPIGTIGNGVTKTIPPGDYIVTSLTMSGTASVNMGPSAIPTRMFVQGPSGGGTVISAGNTTNVNMTGISGGTGFNTTGSNGIANGAASNQHVVNGTTSGGIVESSGSAKSLQIYYSGSGNMFLQGNMRGVIYAPYATINIGATQSGTTINALAQDANFYGSVTGAIVNLMADYTNGGAAYLHYDRNLRGSNTGYIDPYARLSPFPSAPTIQGYRAVTWQEAI